MAKKHSNMSRLEALVATLPEAVRVDVEEWGDHPTFRVRNKNFVFTNDTATSLGVKLSKEEAAAVIATDDRVDPMGYGLGRHGWISLDRPDPMSAAQWQEFEEWVLTSYTLVAPKSLAKKVLPPD
ncbi:MAG: MmcQ/YjbR family DNA-binding protein [Acidimicrobiales bacterium]